MGEKRVKRRERKWIFTFEWWGGREGGKINVCEFAFL